MNRFNFFTAPACEISGLKSAHIHDCKQCVWWSSNKSTFNTVHFDRNPFTCSCEGGKKALMVLHFGTFIDRLLSDGAASMAVKRLNLLVSSELYIRTPNKQLDLWKSMEWTSGTVEQGRRGTNWKPLLQVYVMISVHYTASLSSGTNSNLGDFFLCTRV